MLVYDDLILRRGPRKRSQVHTPAPPLHQHEEGSLGPEQTSGWASACLRAQRYFMHRTAIKLIVPCTCEADRFTSSTCTKRTYS